MFEHIIDNLAATGDFVLSLAQEAGSDQASVTLAQAGSLSAAYRDGEMEEARSSRPQGLSVSLFVNKRYGSYSTNDLRDEALRDFIQRSITLTRELEPEEARSLPDPGRYAARPPEDLKLFAEEVADLDALTINRLAKQAEEALRSEAEALGVDPVTVNGAASRSFTHLYHAASNGFAGAMSKTSWSVSSQIGIMDPSRKGQRRLGGFGVHFASFQDWQPERAVHQAAREAVARAAGQLEARPVASGRYTVLVENTAALRLVSALLSPLSGQNIYHGQSFLSGQSGCPVACPLLTLTDAPGLPGRLGSRWFDEEGAASTPMPLIEKGILKNFYLDTFHARVLNMQPTTASPSNIVLQPTVKAGFREMLADLGEGLAVTGFLGGNHNPTTGDFSFGINGYRVRQGRILHPVDGMNMSGNFRKLWPSLMEAGDDAWQFSSLLVPSLLFECADFSGK